MNLRMRGVSRALVGTLGLAVTVAGAGAGCGGSHNNYPAPSVHIDARSGTGGASGDAGVRPTPVIGDRVATLVSGAAFLVGAGQDSCTSQDPPSGDRWCAFTMPSNFAGRDDLWVINVTKAATGTIPIKCDVSDLNCLLLSSTLYTGDLTLHGFFGDTLIFYAEAGQSTAAGYAWRPGMTSARRLTPNALPGGCTGHRTTDAVRCLQNPDNTTVTGQTTFDLSAGFVTAGGNAPLPKVTTFIAALTTDPAPTTGATPPARYRANLSADGTWIAWSARPDPASPETLVAQKIGDASTRVTVAQDVSRWAFSRDGNSVYWLKSFNYDPASPLGTLQSTAFPVPPAGTAPTVTTIRPNTAFFAPVGDTGLLVLGALNGGAGQLSLITNSAQPTSVKVLDEAVSQPLSVSLDGRDVVYSRSGLDLLANGVDFASECTMPATGSAALPFGTFSDPPSTVFWVKPDGMTGKYLGYYTNVANCKSTMFTTGFWNWTPVKDQGLVYGDEVFIDGLGNVGDVTLRYASLAGGVLTPAAMPIQTRANPTFALLLPYLSAVLYTVNAGGDTDGLYLRVDLPFLAATPPPPPLQHPDAGVGQVDSANSGNDGGSDASGGGG